MIRGTVVVAGIAAIAFAAPASAASELGQTTTNSTDTCGPANQLVWQTAAPYLAPAKGVITELRVSSGSAGATFSAKIIRPAGNAIVFTTAPLTVATAGQVVSTTVHAPVEPGDALGMWLGSANSGCFVPGGPSDTASVVPGSADQPVGPITGTITTGAGLRLAVAARFELDADGDGKGDDTEDSCPTDAAITTGPCAADVRVSAAATPATIGLGDIAVLDMSAALQGAGTARGVNVSAVLPSGLTPVLAAPRSCPLTAAFTCALGDFGTGSREAVVVVRGTKTGTYAVAVGATSTTPDPTPANNVATVAIKVVTTTKGCKVPALKGRKKSFASALLKAAGCKLGTTKRKTIKKGKSGRVIAQGKKAGSVVPPGTRVAITLSKRRT